MLVDYGHRPLRQVDAILRAGHAFDSLPPPVTSYAPISSLVDIVWTCGESLRGIRAARWLGRPVPGTRGSLMTVTRRLLRDVNVIQAGVFLSSSPTLS
jgi:hypothetical protein